MQNALFFEKLNAGISNDFQEEEIGQVCIANISPAERKIRLDFAKGQMVIGLLLLLGLIAFDVNPAWRLLLFGVFSAAGTSYFQARDKT